jgi:hypothetical protein
MFNCCLTIVIYPAVPDDLILGIPQGLSPILSQRGSGIARAGEELSCQSQVLATSLLDLGLTCGALVRVFGGGALQAQQAPIELRLMGLAV